MPFIAFFCSGASSLIFQALWTRMLHHTFGATSVAMSTVLSAFMGGLGLGAYLFGRRAARFRSPLAVYAAAELGVAAWALVIPPLVRSDGPFALLNAALRHALGESTVAFMLARFCCVLPLLLVPTTLMGGTLPLLAQHFVHGADRLGARAASARVGALYALNTFGAVAGATLSSFVLMPAIGVRATNLAAVAINVALGVAVLVLARRTRFGTGAAAAPEAGADSTAGEREPESGREAEPAGAPQPEREAAHESIAGPRLALIAFAASGACAMAYEVVWSRALAMAIGSSLQSFALILITFLLGIAGGSAVAAHLLSAARTRGLALLGALSGLLTLLALVPALLLSSAALALGAWLALCAALGLFVSATVARARDLALAGVDDDALAAEAARLVESAGPKCLLVPCAVALFELSRFALARSSLAAVTVHGYLPYITAATVLASALFLAILAALRRSLWLLAGGIQVAIALATFASFLCQDEIPYSFARLVSALEDLPSHVGTVRFFMLLAAGLSTLPAALGMGAMFPITLALWRTVHARASAGERNDVTRAGAGERQNAVGSDVGRVYAANTLGSIVGAWLPGFVLLPLWGMENTLALGMAINAATALALLHTGWRAYPSHTRAAAALALAALTLIVVLAADRALPSSPLRWNLSHMTLGAFRVSLAREVLNQEAWGQPDLVYYRDGVSTTVSVERWGRHRTLKNNGKVDASNGDDMPTQIMVAAYPLLLHPRGPEGLDVAIVGFGSGVTVGAALQFPVRHVDAMELESAVVEAAASFFSDVSHLEKSSDRFPYVRAPRLTLHHDDGRNFLAAAPDRYDVIVSEPSNPWITGVSDLFTVDHFRVSKAKLKPGGVYCQWVQLYELSPENIKTVYRTFASQFRYVLAFSAEELSSDTILIGSDAPLPIDLARSERALRDPRIAAELERAYVHSASDVWSRILFATREEVLRFTHSEWRIETRRSAREQSDVEGRAGWREQLRATGAEPCLPPACRREPVPLNTDDNMLIELRAPADLIGFARYEGYLQVFYGPSWPYGDLVPRLRNSDGERARAMALSLLVHGRKGMARAFAGRAPAPADREARIDAETIALLLDEGPDPPLEFAPPLPSVPLAPALKAAFWRSYEEAQRAFADGEYGTSVRALERLPAPLRTLSGPDLRFLFGLALSRSAADDLAQQKRAVAELEELIRRDETYSDLHPELYYYLARALDRARSFDKAVRNMRTYAATVIAP